MLAKINQPLTLAPEPQLITTFVPRPFLLKGTLNMQKDEMLQAGFEPISYKDF